MEKWRQAVELFLNDWKKMKTLLGRWFCGSYVTGNPSEHSDIDLHLLLKSGIDWRERGNKVVDGYLIEYFANPKEQILKYFHEEIASRSCVTAHMFASGEILFDKTGEELGSIGHEFGATTGRKRRCGWIDLVAMRYAVAVNGITELALTKLDVLDGFEEIQVCNSYMFDGKEIFDFPTDHETLSRVKPVLTSMKGWMASNAEARKFEEMQPASKEFVEFLESELEVPVTFISVGPGRNETVFR